MQTGEAAKILGVSVPTVHAMVRDGLLEADKVKPANGRWYYELLNSDVYLVAEVLRDLERRRERTRGRGRSPTRGEVLRYWRQGYSIDWIAARMKIKRHSVHRALNRAGIVFNSKGEVVCDRAAS